MKIKEKKAELFVGIVLLVGAAGLLLFSREENSPTESANQTASSNQHHSKKAVAASADDARESQKHKLRDRTKAQPKTQGETTESELVDSESNPIHEMDPAEKWAESSYWSQSDIFSLPLNDHTELKRLAESGNVYAQAVWGNHLIRDRNDTQAGVDWLLEAASQGSQFALWQLRNLYYHGAGPLNVDRDASIAWGFVSFMLGNWRAFDPGMGFGIPEMDADRWLIISVMAANFFAEINARHRARTGENMAIQLRPGFDRTVMEIIQTPAVPLP